MNQTMRNKVINFLINEKDNLIDDIGDYVYPDILHTYEPLTEKEIQEINNLRKQILDVYALIDILGGVDL